MFKQNDKGTVSPAILIISIVIALLAFGVTAGIIIWKVVGDGGYSRSSRDRDRDQEEEREIEEEEKPGPDGFVDCGTVMSFMGDFASPFEIDFDQDSAMVCMGKNIKNNCTNAKSLVRTDEDFTLHFKALGTSKSNCKTRLDIYEQGEYYFIECPNSGLTSVPDLDSEYAPIKEKLSGASGDYAGGLFLVIAFIIFEGDGTTASNIGCVHNL